MKFVPLGSTENKAAQLMVISSLNPGIYDLFSNTTQVIVRSQAFPDKQPRVIWKNIIFCYQEHIQKNGFKIYS